MVKCPYCNSISTWLILKTWRFKFYTVTMVECLNCKGIFNHYTGISPRGKKSEFIVRVKPKVKQKVEK